MTQNMGLLVSPAPYLGSDRKGAITEIATQIRLLEPDVVGLCEVFDDDERARIRRWLSDKYPYWRDGPDEADLESDGGLLILSKHPFLAAADMIFRQSDGWDRLANKGVIHVRIKPSSWPIGLDVFYSHMQDISTGNGVATLYAQLGAMDAFIAAHAGTDLPRIVMGDLNIPGEQPQHYAQLLARLTSVRDCWTLAGNSTASGFTHVRNSSFHDDPDDRPSSDQRLDYVLLHGSSRTVPILSSIRVLQIEHNVRHISDHFGLQADFDQIVILSP